MPGFDGTGPGGAGPLTGGGFGYCVGAAGAGRLGRGRGGRVGGGGYGRGWCRWQAVDEPAPAEEKAFLEQRLDRIEQEAARIRERLEDFES